MGARVLISAGWYERFDNALQCRQCSQYAGYSSDCRKAWRGLGSFGPRFRDPLSLTKQDYLDFLSFKHNHHWTGLERPGRQATDDMEILREAIALLVDETKPISERFNTALSLVRGAGAATLTLDAQFGVAAGPDF